MIKKGPGSCSYEIQEKKEFPELAKVQATAELVVFACFSCCGRVRERQHLHLNQSELRTLCHDECSSRIVAHGYSMRVNGS